MIAFTVTRKRIVQSVWFSAAAALAAISLLAMSFLLAEPRIGHGQASDTATFRIRQTITDETTFLVNPSNVTMSGNINGLTGGNATGSTPFSVQSNNASGYYVEIDFFDNGTPEAMIGDDDDSESIRDWSGATSTPIYTFTASTAAQFAYTINSSTTLDTDDSFLYNGSNLCQGAGASSQSIYHCWMTPSTTAFRIVDRSTAAPSGATSTLIFKVNVPSSPAPTLTAQTYTATATLSVFVQ
ncbi:MAG: hypothetical protein AAB388_05000 [Patescibacteria group bacterium]